MKHTIAALLLMVTLPVAVRAEAEKAPEPSIKFEHLYETYTLNEDGAAVIVRDRAMTVLKKDAVDEAKETAISYSTSVEKAEIIAANTRKPDGRRIPVPKDNFQLEVNGGKDKGGPAFSDYTTMSIIFPDVSVGDTLELSYKITQSEPMFPKQFSTLGSFPKSYIYDDVKVTIDAPTALGGKYEAPGMTEKSVAEKAGRTTVVWTFQNKQPIKSKRTAISVYDFGSEPGYIYSTFPSYAAISAAYGARAKPRAVVTERIQKLAETVAKDKTTPQGQAEALYDWVRENISYAGNCIGVGAVVPRDLNFVLDNKMGDCKDHATLLQALLTAKGIASTQALINVGAMYRLPKIPVVSTVNHVINYIPSLHTFLDSTAAIYPYGMLPDSEGGKPVLLVDDYKDDTKTPVIPHDAEGQSVKTAIKIAEDGTATGSVEVTLKGVDAITARESFKKLPPDREADFTKALLKRYSLEGTAQIVHHDKIKTIDSFSYGYTFSITHFVRPGSAGAFYVYPLFASAQIYDNLVGTAQMDDIVGDFVCGGGHFREDYAYTFPKNVKVLATPDNFKVADAVQSYAATYALTDNVLTITRQLDDVTPGHVCAPEIFKGYKILAAKALPDLKSQVVYK